MFGIFKKLFGKADTLTPASPTPASPEKVPVGPAKPAAPAPPAKASMAAAGMSQPAAVPVKPVEPEDAIQFPLKTLIEKIPAELKGKVARAPGAGDMVTVSRQAVLAQLAGGSVKISFAELRQGSPAGLLSEAGDLDHVKVEIPLPEILSRVDPALLPRRTGQKRIHVPDDVVGLFGAQTAKAVVTAANAKAEEPTPTPTPTPTPAPAPAAPIQVAAQLKDMMASAPPPPAVTKPVTPTITSVAKTSPPAKPIAPLPGMAPTAPPTKPATTMPGLTPSASVPKPASAAPVGSPQPAVSTPAVASAPSVAGMIAVQISALSENWPELIKHEINQLNLGNAILQIPAEEVGRGLKFGKVAFTWQQLLSWAQPVPSGTTSQASVTVDLPLKIVAPLYLAQHQPGKAQKKLAVAESIPDLFSGKSAPSTSAVVTTAVAAPETAAVPAPAPAPTPIRLAPPTVPSTPPAKVPACLGDLLGQPGQKHYELNEIVQKSTSLPGVGGALMTLSDGWLVAAELPPGLSSDNVAGFVSQVFGRANQFAKDLGTGELTNMQFATGKIPWLICNGGDVFFAVMGRADEPLPVKQVEFIADELRKQNQK